MNRQDLTQKQLENEQDGQLDQIITISHKLHIHAIDIEKEGEHQRHLMGKLHDDIDHTQSNFNYVNKKLSALLKASDLLILVAIWCHNSNC